MWMLKIISVTAILVLFCGQLDAKPHQQHLTRHKRMSDQRLAELETLIALSKMKGKFVTVPIGFGKVDPNKLFWDKVYLQEYHCGRRRRSVSLLLRQLADDLSTEEKRSDEFLQSYEQREEDGGEEKEADLTPN